MKFIFGGLCCMMITGYVADAQTLQKTWDKLYRGNHQDGIMRIAETADHGLAIAGISSSGIGGDKSQDNFDTSYNSFDFWLVKADSAGNFLWDKTFGGTADENLTDMKETADHGFILAGTTRSDSTGTGDVTEPSRSPGFKDYWMIKIDSAGNKQWDKRFGGNATDLLYSIVQTSDGGYLLGGTSLSTQSGDKSSDNHASFGLTFDYWVVKTDASGNKLWDKTIGGSGDDVMYDATDLGGNGYFIAGQSRSNISGDKTSDSRGSWDYWLLNLDVSGNILWDKTLGGDNDDFFYSMALAADGGVVLAGTSRSSDSIGEKTVPSRGGDDYWIVKTDAAGTKLWDQVFGGADVEDDLSKIILTQDNGYLISGCSYSHITGDKTEDNLGLEQGWLVKTDSNGVFQWDRTILTAGHDELGYGIQTNEGCYVTAVQTEADTGGYKTLHNLSGQDYWIVKLCYEAPVVSFISSDTIFCAKTCIDFFDLSTNNPVSWIWSFPGAVPSSSTDQNPVGICYNAYGSFDVSLVAVSPFGSDTLTVTNLIIEYLLSPPVVTVNGDTLFCSPAFGYQWYHDTVPVPGATGNYFVIPSPGSYSVLIYDSLGCAASSQVFTTGITGVHNPMPVEIIPNPSSGDFILMLSGIKNEQTLLRIHGLDGGAVYEKSITTSGFREQIPISLRGQPAGIYFLTVTGRTGAFRAKLLIR